MNSLYDIFTPIDQLRQDEPEYFRPAFQSSQTVASSSAGTSVMKTAVSILEEGCKKVYSETPDYTTVAQTSTNNLMIFTMECRIMGVVGMGKAKTKKQAKQLAAKEALRGIVKKDRYREFNIPATTKEEAYAFVDSLVSDDGVSTVEEGSPAPILGQNENWVGKVMEMCQRFKIDAPKYSDEQHGPPNDRTFKSICEVLNFHSEGTGKTKKASKAESARMMFSLLEKSRTDMDDELDFNDGESEDEESKAPVENPAINAARIDPAPKKTLDEMLSDKERFESYSIIYKSLTMPDTNNDTQVLLKIKFAPVNESERLHVFPGTGSDLVQAENSAARNALITINTFAVPFTLPMPVVQSKKDEESLAT